MSAMSICNMVGECLRNLWSWMCQSWCGRDTSLPLDNGGDARDPEEYITMSQFPREEEQLRPTNSFSSSPPSLSYFLLFPFSSSSSLPSSSSSSLLPSFSSSFSSSDLTAVSEEINDRHSDALDDAGGVDAAKEETVGPSYFPV